MLTNPIQAQIERIPSGVRRIVVALAAIALLAFLFPLRDDDRYDGLLPTSTIGLPPIGDDSNGSAAQPDNNTNNAANASANSGSDDAPNSELSSSAGSSASGTSRPAVIATTRPTPTPCPVDPDWTVYVVQSGDTLDSIARLAQSTVNELLQGNCILNPNRIQPGQAVFVPSLPAMNAALSATPPPTFTLTPNSTPLASATIASSG